MSKEDEYDFLFKIVLIGDSGTGKTWNHRLNVDPPEAQLCADGPRRSFETNEQFGSRAWFNHLGKF